MRAMAEKNGYADLAHEHTYHKKSAIIVYIRLLFGTTNIGDPPKNDRNRVQG